MEDMKPTKFSTSNGYKMITPEIPPQSTEYLNYLVDNDLSVTYVMRNRRDLKVGQLVMVEAVDPHNRTRYFWGACTMMFNDLVTVRFNN